MWVAGGRCVVWHLSVSTVDSKKLLRVVMEIKQVERCMDRNGNVPCARYPSGQLKGGGVSSPPQPSCFQALLFWQFILIMCPFPSLLFHMIFQQIWWLDPELTYGNAKPFVFTQGHSVCNRSFFPCFDTPAVKCTYSATVKVSDWTALNGSWSTQLLLTCESMVLLCMDTWEKILIVTVL